MALHLYTFIKLLSYHHGFFGCESQLIGCILLQTACGKRRKRLAAPLFVCNLSHFVFAGIEISYNIVCFFLIGYGNLFPLIFCELCVKTSAFFKVSIYIPVFFRDKVSYLVLAIAYYLKSGRLNSSCGKSSADLSP